MEAASSDVEDALSSADSNAPLVDAGGASAPHSSWARASIHGSRLLVGAGVVAGLLLLLLNGGKQLGMGESLGSAPAAGSADAALVQSARRHAAVDGAVHSLAEAETGHGVESAPVVVLAQVSTPSKETLRSRAGQVRAAVRHAWGAYRRLAWGSDSLLPLSGRGADTGLAQAVTMVDSLDTLWIMDLREEFAESRDWLAENLPAKIDSIPEKASIFETGIRTLGGLLGAYEFSQDQVFLDLSVRLARRIVAKTDSAGITPYAFDGTLGGVGCKSLVQSGSLQLEMRYLSHISGDKSFAEKTDRFYDTVRRARTFDGLWANCFQDEMGSISIGADGDSFYEYLLKAWHQGGQQDDRLWEMYDAAARGVGKHMVRKGPDSLTYLGGLTWNGTNGLWYVPNFEHLACFVPGWLALGAMSSRGAATRAERMELAENVAYSCWQMYAQQPTGIGPERVTNMKMDLSDTDTRWYILRPEALEGWWYMHEYTRDPRYREWGWKTFQAFEEHLRVPNGYASLADVRSTDYDSHIDRMESFFLAETLKYAYLLQKPDHGLSLDRYVFTTEAHPLSVLRKPEAKS